MEIVIATANVLGSKAPWRRLGHVVGWQEVTTRAWTDAASRQAAKTGHALFIPTGTSARAVTTSYDKSKARLIDGTQGAIRAHGGMRGVSPHRWISFLGLKLEDRSTLLHLNTHMVSGTRRRKVTELPWRKDRWYRHDVLLHALAAIALGRPVVEPPEKAQKWWRDYQPELIKFRAMVERLKPDHVVVTGDYNQAPTRTRVPGLSVAWSRHSGGIDQIHYSSGLHYVSARQGEKRGSDHPPFIVTLSTADVPTPPVPPKPDPEVIVKDDRYELTTHDGKTVDRMTKQALEKAERRLGYDLTVVQGSYHRGVRQSAGTHDGGGTVDLAPWDWERKVRMLREIGFAAWHRTPNQGPWGEHIHAVLIGNEKASPSALRQVDAYKRGRNGLASNGVDDFWRPKTIKPYVYKAPPPPSRISVFRRAVEEALAVTLPKIDSVDRPHAYRMLKEIQASLDKGPKA